MQQQQKISQEYQDGLIGKVLDVMIDERETACENVFIGRTECDAPDVDGVVHVNSALGLRPGQIVPVKITDALEYDLVGEA